MYSSGDDQKDDDYVSPPLTPNISHSLATTPPSRTLLPPPSSMCFWGLPFLAGAHVTAQSTHCAARIIPASHHDFPLSRERTNKPEEILPRRDSGSCLRPDPGTIEPDQRRTETDGPRPRPQTSNKYAQCAPPSEPPVHGLCSHTCMAQMCMAHMCMVCTAFVHTRLWLTHLLL